VDADYQCTSIVILVRSFLWLFLEIINLHKEEGDQPSTGSYNTRNITKTLPETQRKIHTKHDMKDTRQVNVKMVRLEVYSRFVEALAHPETVKTCTSTCTSSHQNQAAFNTRKPRAPTTRFKG
jgi:hypothetical protein